METRMNRNKELRKQVKKEMRKQKIKALVIIYNVLKFIVSKLTWLVYITLRFINNLVAKLYMKLPRILKVLVVYTLLVGFVFSIIDFTDKQAVQEELKSDALVLTIKEETEVQLPDEEEKVVCKLDEVSCKIYVEAITQGLTKEQAYMTISIAMWETGRYTSDAFKNKNNVGGMMMWNGSKSVLRIYDSLDNGINAFITNLKNNYFDLGLDTLEKIQIKYCPIGASNDPKGLNKYWLNGVTKIFNSLTIESK